MDLAKKKHAFQTEFKSVEQVVSQASVWGQHVERAQINMKWASEDLTTIATEAKKRCRN